MSLDLNELFKLSRGYFRNVISYNHDIIKPQNDHTDISHDSEKGVATTLFKLVDSTLTNGGRLSFIAKCGKSMLMFTLKSDNDDKSFYIDCEIISEGDGKKVCKTHNIKVDYDYDNKKLTIKTSILPLDDMEITSGSDCVIAILVDDHKYSQWNKVTRRILIKEVEDKDLKAVSCKHNFLLEDETDSDLTLSRDTFVYERTDLNTCFMVYDNISFYGLLHCKEETLYTRFEKKTDDGKMTLSIGEGTLLQEITGLSSSISDDGLIEITLDTNTALTEGNYKLSILFVVIGIAQINMSRHYDVRQILFTTPDGLEPRSRYIGKVTADMIKMIPEYKKFTLVDPSIVYDKHPVSFYGLDVDTSLIMLQADNTSQYAEGYPDDKSGLTLRYIDDKDTQQHILLPNDLEKACYLNQKTDTYMCSDYDYAKADSDGLVFNSKLVKSLDLFNYKFVMDSGDVLPICNINSTADNEARIPFTMLCEMDTYRYFLSDCYKDRFTIPVGEDGKLAKFDNFSPYSVNKDYCSKKDGIDSNLTFNTMFSTVKLSGYESWAIAFQINMTNIDAVDKETVYFDKAVPYGQTRYVYLYIIRAKTSMVIFKHADFDGTEIFEVASVSLIKLNNLDAIECKTANGERFVISGADKNGKVYVMRGGHLERCLPINALADFDKKNENYNVYKCNIAALYVDYDSKKKEVQPRGDAVDAFINIYVPNIDIRLNDQYTVDDFYTFCTKQIDQYKTTISGHSDEELADPTATGGYTSIQAIYDAFTTAYAGDKISPLNSLYIYIGIEYNYNYTLSGSSYSIPHYFSKLIRYKIDSNEEFTQGTNSGTNFYNIKKATICNFIENTSYEYELDYSAFDNSYTVCTINQNGSAYTIDFKILAVNTLENMIIQGDLKTTVGAGDYDDVLDYIDNNGIDMYQVNTWNGSASVVFPVDFINREMASGTTTEVKVSKIVIRCIPTKPVSGS